MVVEKGRQDQASEMLYGGRESMGESVGYREGETVSVNRRLSPREGNQQGIVWLL